MDGKSFLNTAGQVSVEKNHMTYMFHRWNHTNLSSKVLNIRESTQITSKFEVFGQWDNYSQYFSKYNPTVYMCVCVRVCVCVCYSISLVVFNKLLVLVDWSCLQQCSRGNDHSGYGLSQWGTTLYIVTSGIGWVHTQNDPCGGNNRISVTDTSSRQVETENCYGKVGESCEGW